MDIFNYASTKFNNARSRFNGVSRTKKAIYGTILGAGLIIGGGSYAIHKVNQNNAIEAQKVAEKKAADERAAAKVAADKKAADEKKAADDNAAQALAKAEPVNPEPAADVAEPKADAKAPVAEAKPVLSEKKADAVDKKSELPKSLETFVSTSDLKGGRHGVCAGYIGPVVYDNRDAAATHAVLFQAYGLDVTSLKMRVFVEGKSTKYEIPASFTVINKMYHAKYSTENLLVDGKKATSEQETELREYMTTTISSDDSLQHIVTAYDSDGDAVASTTEDVCEITYVGKSGDYTAQGFVKKGEGIDPARVARSSASQKSEGSKSASLEGRVEESRVTERTEVAAVQKNPALSVPNYGITPEVTRQLTDYTLKTGKDFHYGTLYVQPMTFSAPTGLNFNSGAFSFTYGDVTGAAKFDPKKPGKK